jgi:hypothetical protein
VEEKRKLERFDLNLLARIRMAPLEKKEINALLIDLPCWNISSGGAFFHTGEPLPEGAKVHMDILLEVEQLKKITGKRALIMVDGTVLRANQNGMAVRFDNEYEIKPVL